MPEPNRLLRAARERLPSPGAPGEHASRSEVAEAVNAWLWETTGKRHLLDAHYLAKLERGVARWPNAAYRSGLRHVLGVPEDAALGFVPPRRSAGAVDSLQTPSPLPGWEPGLVLEHAGHITDHDLVAPSRRTVLGAILLTGAALGAALAPFLHPLAVAPDRHGTAFAALELDAAEQFVSVLRTWHSTRGAVSRPTVAAQLSTHVAWLCAAPQGTAQTLRGFRIGAELADIAATMAWDAGEHRIAQRYFVLAVQLAHAAGDNALAAVALASLARQCFDLERPADGLDVVQLAQYGTRRTATPRLRAVLATREAWAYAQQGDARAFQRAVGLAEDYHAEGARDGDATTPTARSLDAAELAGVIGARYRDLARYDPKHARQAQNYIGRALQLRHTSRARNRAFDLIGLARAHLVSREPDRAAELIAVAVPLAGAWASGRVGVKLRDFHREAAPFASVAAMREARENIADLIAA
ncbi:hypothetical protein [Amycolatopsis magusensis]|uniref:N-acetyltransferase YhbS n=1 Tax=Amycolatopsis magusensis TaxID=882444 RepID=A0ABS4PU82_9PSEU|nr:hypothetical protein [Amycolatopsis magusensis]MBP2182863.1 putative N-acetyltransferase YhbS [Amycolatopsis magusensis]